MPELPCEPFVQCTQLDARLLISTALQGPPIAGDMGEIPLGRFTAQGAAIRPYVDVRLEQVWVAKEACYGPIRSIFSLAPGETVSITTTVRHLTEVTTLVERASGSERERRGPKSPFAGNVFGAVVMANRQVSKFGSIFDDIVGGIGSVIDAAEDTVSGVVKGVAGLVQHAVGGGHGPGVTDAIARANQVVESINVSESQLSRTESVREDETTQTITRTFSNPYRDRSLQLRFIPTFRHFEVTTFLRSVTPGVSMQVGPLQKAGTNKNIGQLGQAATKMTTNASVGALQKPMATLLNRDRSSVAKGADVKSSLKWSDSHVREDSLFVPFAEQKTAGDALNLKGQPKASFEKNMHGISAETIAALKRPAPQHVHLFIGTHIEPVAGGCVLVDVPPLE